MDGCQDDGDSLRGSGGRMILKMGFRTLTSPKRSSERDKNEPSRFLGDGVSFRAKLIGILEVGEARGERMCQEALADLKMAVRAAGEHKQRIVVCVAIDGLRLRDDKTGDCLYHHPVHKISFIAQDMTDSRAFGYIFGSPDTGHRFFGIKTDKAASQVVIAMRDLFQVVFELKKKEIEMAKQHIEQQQQLKYSSKYSDLSSKESADQGKMRTIEEDQGESCVGSSGGRGRRHTSSTAAAAAVVAISPPPRHQNALQHQHHTSEVIADLLDLEIELSSIQAGIHQMEKMTPSDPFGPGATTPSAVSSLHIPSLPSHMSPTVSVEDPFGDSFVGPSAAAISLTSSSSLSMQASKRQALTEPSMGNTSADTSWFEKPLGSEDLFAEVGEAGAGREQENQNGGTGQHSDSGKAEERMMSAQFDVFTELDPLGTGRSRPYIDKKDFFQDLKNPPKKVLRDLVTDTPCTHSVTPPAFPATVPLFNAMFDDASQPTFFPSPFPASSDLFTESIFPSGTDASASSVAPSPPPLAAEDPFADTDPFVSAPSAVSLSDVDVSGIFPRIEDDPFDTDFANLSSSRRKRVDSATVGRKPRKGITHGPLRVSLPPEKKSLDSPVLLPPPPTGTGTMPRSRSRSPRSLAPITRTSPQSPPEPPPRPDSAAKPPPLPPKRVSAPTSRQAEDTSQYEFIDQYETSPRPAVESKTVPRAIRKSCLPPPPRRQHQRVSPSAESEALKQAVVVPTESTPPATSFDLTLAELGKMSIADLASALHIPPERVSTMTLQELAEKLSTCRTKSASDKEEEYAKQDRYASLRESLDDECASTAATFSANFEAKFEEEFNKENEQKDDVFCEVSSFDKYAVFRELIDSEVEKESTLAVEATREESPQNEASDASKEEREEEEKAKEEEEESSREEAAEDKYAALREICVEEEKGEEEAGGAAETNSSEERNEKVEEAADLVVLSREEGIVESGKAEGKDEEWAKENVGWANFPEKATDGGESEEAASPWSSESREAVGWEGAWGSEGKADYGSRSEVKRGCRWRRSEEEEEEERRRPRRSRKAAWVEEEGRRRCWEEGARRRQRVRKPSTWGDEEDEGEEEEEEWEEEDWRGKKRRARRRSVEWDAEEEEEDRGGRRPVRRREGTWDRRGKSYRSWDEEDEAEEDYEEGGSRRCRRVRTASGEGSSRATSRHFRNEPEEFGRERGREMGHRRRTTPTPSSFGQRKAGPHRWQQRREEEEEEEEERWGRRSGGGTRRGRQRGKEAPMGKRTTSRGSSGGRLQSPFEDDFVHGTGGGGSSVSSDVSERSPVVHNGRCSDDVFLPCDASSVDTFPETTTQRPFSAPVEGAKTRMERPRGGARASGLISSTSHRTQRQQSSELGNGGLRKSESVNIFARDSDPFDDDFFSSGNAGRGQKTSSSADPFKWTEPFGHFEFREEEEDDEEGERVTAAGQVD